MSSVILILLMFPRRNSKNSHKLQCKWNSYLTLIKCNPVKCQRKNYLSETSKIIIYGSATVSIQDKIIIICLGNISSLMVFIRRVKLAVLYSE